VTVTLVFVDRLTGDAVPGGGGVHKWREKTAGQDGKVTVSAEGPIRFEGYVDPLPLQDLGFYIIGPSYYCYFACTAEQSFSRTVILERLSGPPVGYAIDGIAFFPFPVKREPLSTKHLFMGILLTNRPRAK
jgi:hypothetical protein